jgi:hypothetical protein
VVVVFPTLRGAVPLLVAKFLSPEVYTAMRVYGAAVDAAVGSACPVHWAVVVPETVLTGWAEQAAMGTAVPPLGV